MSLNTNGVHDFLTRARRRASLPALDLFRRVQQYRTHFVAGFAGDGGRGVVEAGSTSMRFFVFRISDCAE
eukprot:3386386-Pyramimonas_sp.AAC.1